MAKGRHLTALEIGALRDLLRQNMAPWMMRGLIDAVREITGFKEAYQAGLAPMMRDAYIALHVAELRTAELVRLNPLFPLDRPDFAIAIGGMEYLFEAVSADQPGRRLAAEYKEADGLYPDCDPPPEDDPCEAVEARSANAAVMLETAAQMKAAKAAKGDYDRAWGLVIYLNLMEYGRFQEQVESVMETSTASAHGLFREVIILWKDRLYSVGEKSRAT